MDLFDRLSDDRLPSLFVKQDVWRRTDDLQFLCRLLLPKVPAEALRISVYLVGHLFERDVETALSRLSNTVDDVLHREGGLACAGSAGHQDSIARQESSVEHPVEFGVP